MKFVSLGDWTCLSFTDWTKNRILDIKRFLFTVCLRISKCIRRLPTVVLHYTQLSSASTYSHINNWQLIWGDFVTDDS